MEVHFSSNYFTEEVLKEGMDKFKKNLFQEKINFKCPSLGEKISKSLEYLELINKIGDGTGHYFFGGPLDGFLFFDSASL